jgi:predicted RNA-binding protein YlqC (UPF0109 family)
MKDLLTFLVKSIVENEDAVVIEEHEGENAFIYKISVAPEDMGRVIGRQGRIAKAIRTIAKSIAVRDNRKVVINIGR